MRKTVMGGSAAAAALAATYLGGGFGMGGPPPAVRDARAVSAAGRALHLSAIGVFKPPTADGDLNVRTLAVEDTAAQMETVAAQGLALALRDYDAAPADPSRKVAARHVHAAIAKLRELAQALDNGPPAVITRRTALLAVLDQAEKDVP